MPRLHSLVQNPSNKTAHRKPYDNRQRDRSSRRRKANPSNKNNRLDALPQHSNEGQHKHGVFLKESLDPAAHGKFSSVNRSLHGGGQLDAPFLLHLADAQQCEAHHRDDHRGDQAECAFVVELGGVPFVGPYRVEDADYGAAYYEAD